MFFCTLIECHKLQEAHLKFSPQKAFFAKTEQNKIYLLHTHTRWSFNIRAHELIGSLIIFQLNGVWRIIHFCVERERGSLYIWDKNPMAPTLSISKTYCLHKNNMKKKKIWLPLSKIFMTLTKKVIHWANHTENLIGFDYIASNNLFLTNKSTEIELYNNFHITLCLHLDNGCWWGWKNKKILAKWKRLFRCRIENNINRS